MGGDCKEETQKVREVYVNQSNKFCLSFVCFVSFADCRTGGLAALESCKE